MAVAVAQTKRPALTEGLHEVRVRIEDATNGKVGEAVTFIRSNSAGLGF